ncbi:recombinase family protein [Streptomyces hydrogenans]|uniref:recombinase family protein n=1 Tax=Streptomyces hydrogenans TaxID=1873719 RepID=UPI0035E132BC
MTGDRKPVDRVYLRHSTDKQTDIRQRHALAPLLAAGAPVYEDPATSSRVLSLERPGFKQLLDEAAVGDTIRIADAARLFRSVADIIALRPVLIRRGLHLRVESGLLSGIDLASDDPGTKMMVSVLAAVLEFQRDMISENTREGVAAAAAAGKTLGRPAALDEDQTAGVIGAYRDGAAVKALAREYGVSPKTIRRILDEAGAREVPAVEEVLADEGVDPSSLAGISGAAANPILVVDVPGLVAEHLQTASEDVAIRYSLADGQSVRRGQGYSVRVTAPADVHRAMVDASTGLMGSPAGRKARRIHTERVTTAYDRVTAARTQP